MVTGEPIRFFFLCKRVSSVVALSIDPMFDLKLDPLQTVKLHGFDWGGRGRERKSGGKRGSDLEKRKTSKINNSPLDTYMIHLNPVISQNSVLFVLQKKNVHVRIEMIHDSLLLA